MRLPVCCKMSTPTLASHPWTRSTRPQLPAVAGSLEWSLPSSSCSACAWSCAWSRGIEVASMLYKSKSMPMVEVMTMMMVVASWSTLNRKYLNTKYKRKLLQNTPIYLNFAKITCSILRTCYGNECFNFKTVDILQQCRSTLKDEYQSIVFALRCFLYWCTHFDKLHRTSNATTISIIYVPWLL